MHDPREVLYLGRWRPSRAGRITRVFTIENGRQIALPQSPYSRPCPTGYDWGSAGIGSENLAKAIAWHFLGQHLPRFERAWPRVLEIIVSLPPSHAWELNRACLEAVIGATASGKAAGV
jgi:hypothetical protein